MNILCMFGYESPQLYPLSCCKRKYSTAECVRAIALVFTCLLGQLNLVAVNLLCMFGHNTHNTVYGILTRAREIVGFAGSGPIFEIENRFISLQEAKKSVHKTLSFSRFWNTQTDIATCQNCSHLIIRCYLS